MLDRKMRWPRFWGGLPHACTSLPHSLATQSCAELKMSWPGVSAAIDTHVEHMLKTNIC